MRLHEFKKLLLSVAEPVVLLEGSRAVKDEHREKLIEFAANLARAFPAALFRSGAAIGSDAAFAEGVARINQSRLQLVLPNSQKKTAQRSLQVSLEELPPNERAELIELTKRSTPGYTSLIEFYEKGGSGRARYQSQYLIRDALKVVGSEAFRLRPATVGCFYVNSTKAAGGGTGHTIRVCEQSSVPVVAHDDWLRWLRYI